MYHIISRIRFLLYKGVNAKLRFFTVNGKEDKVAHDQKISQLDQIA